MFKNKLIPTTTAVLRFLFFFVFAVLVLFGIFSSPEKRTYIPQNSGTPVISFTIDTSALSSDGYTAEAVNTFTYGNAPVFPGDGAAASAVISADTCDALYLKNADVPMPMASTTKIMTALVAMELLPCELVFTVPPEVCGIEGSSIYLTPYEKIRVEDLLYGLLLESGNDAACALAVAACGNIGDFTALMNKKAADMGLTATHFENPHGLSAKEHFTTAMELAIITYHAMKVPLFRRICGTKSHIVKDENGVPIKYFSNHNKFLRTYSGATGVKTGYTIASGRCLVTSAERDGTSLIAVTLNDRSDFSDHAKLLDHAFENFRTIHIADENSIDFRIGGKIFTNTHEICICKETDDTSPVTVTAELSEKCTEFQS